MVFHQSARGITPEAMASATALLEPRVAATARTLLAHVVRLLGTERARLLLCDPSDPRVLVTVAAVGQPADEVLAADEGAAGRCLTASEPVVGDAVASVPVLTQSGAAGALEASGPDDGRAFTADDVDTLIEVAEVVASLIDQADAGRRLTRTLHAGIEALASLLDLRDGYAGREAGEVAELATAIGTRLGLARAALDELGLAGRVHDIGKIGVPDRILSKPGKLDPDERAVMERHAVWGAETLARIPGLDGVAEIVRSHHERWDGRGYPAGLIGEEIPVAARIIGACEAYRALTTDRPYRRALEPDRAVGLLEQGAGSHFDPAVITNLVALLRERGHAADRPAAVATPPAPRRTPAAAAPPRSGPRGWRSSARAARRRPGPPPWPRRPARAARPRPPRPAGPSATPCPPPSSGSRRSPRWPSRATACSPCCAPGSPRR